MGCKCLHTTQDKAGVCEPTDLHESHQALHVFTADFDTVLVKEFVFYPVIIPDAIILHAALDETFL
jgi:hypothetical protein